VVNLEVQLFRNWDRVADNQIGKSVKSIFIAGFVCALIVPSFAQEAPKLDTSASITLSPKYVWHGVNLVNDWVAQPQVAVGMNGFSLTVWGNIELTDWNLPNYTRNPRGRMTEIDTILDYTGSWKDGSWKVGLIDYQYPGTGFARYSEYYAGMSFAKVWGSPSLTVYNNANPRTGTYAVLSMTKSFEISGVGPAKSVDLLAELTFGNNKFNRTLYGWDKSGFSDLHLAASTSFEVGKGWTLTPALHYTTLFSNNQLAGAPRRTNAWLSISAGYKF